MLPLLWLSLLSKICITYAHIPLLCSLLLKYNITLHDSGYNTVDHFCQFPVFQSVGRLIAGNEVYNPGLQYQRNTGNMCNEYYLLLLSLYSVFGYRLGFAVHGTGTGLRQVSMK